MQKSLDNIIYLLQQQRKKIITLDELKNIINSDGNDSVSQGRIYKITYQLKNRGFIYPLKKELFYISNPDTKINPEEIEEKRYWKLLKSHCTESCKQRYIGGLTALEIYLHNNGVTIPDTITIINKEKQSTETIIFAKKVSFKKYQSNNKNLITPLLKQTSLISLSNTKLPVANLELSILESLYNLNYSDIGYINECIKKAIKKNGKNLDISKIEFIIKQGKYNTSLNKLYNITKSTYPELSENIKHLIKRFGFIL